jgi:hypothetical protein
MSAPTLIRRELKNARIYFVPSGEVLALGNGSSSLTVGIANVFPDNDPLTNYTSYEIPEIEDVKEENTIKKETYTIPAADGGYREEEEEMVTRRMWKATTHKTNNYLKQLQHGLSSAPVVGAAQTPGAKKDNYIDGVMLLEIQNKSGAIIERTQVWSRLRLVTAGDVGPVTAKVEFSLECLPHVSNSYLAVA